MIFDEKDILKKIPIKNTFSSKDQTNTNIQLVAMRTKNSNNDKNSEINESQIKEKISFYQDQEKDYSEIRFFPEKNISFDFSLEKRSIDLKEENSSILKNTNNSQKFARKTLQSKKVHFTKEKKLNSESSFELEELESSDFSENERNFDDEDPRKKSNVSSNSNIQDEDLEIKIQK